MEKKVKIGLKAARENKGISQSQLAGIMKIDVSVIKGWEAGASFPTVEVLRYLASLLNTSTEMLLFSEQREPLDISNLTDKQKSWILDFYKSIVKNT